MSLYIGCLFVLSVISTIFGFREVTYDRPLPPLRRKIVETSIKLICGFGLKLMGVQSIEIEHLKVKDYDSSQIENNIKPTIIVSNHVSFLDPIFFCHHCCPSFLAKQEVGNMPFFGSICRAIQSIFVSRE